MTPDSSTHPHDDLAVYALDALEPEEQAVIDAHLAGCAACRAELATYRDTLGHMTVAEEPPDQVWAGIARQIRPAASEVDAEVESLRPDPTVVHIEDRRRPGRPRWLLPAAAAVAVVVGAGALIAGLGGGSDTPGVAEAAADAAADPDSTLVELAAAPGGDGVARVVVTADDDYVVFDDLPELDGEQTYQLWRTDEAAPVSLGLLGDATEGAVRLNLPEGTTAFAVSREPAGGSAQPTEIVAAEA